MKNISATNKKLFLVLTVLIVTVVLYSFMNSGSRDSLDVDRSLFAVKNTIDVNKFSVQQPGNTFEISYSGSKWMVNDSYPADASRIHVFFATIQQISIRRPVSERRLDEVKNNLLNRGRTLSIYENNKVIKEYKVWGDKKERQTFMMEDEKIYLVEIPGYRTYIYGLFELSESEWKDPRIFALMNWRNLNRLSVYYPSKPENNFNISRGEQFFQVEGINETDTARLIDYIDYVSLITYDKLKESGNISKDTSVMRIEVTDVAGKTFNTEIFKSEGNRFSGILLKDKVYELSTEKMEKLMVSPGYFRQPK